MRQCKFHGVSVVLLDLYNILRLVNYIFWGLHITMSVHAPRPVVATSLKNDSFSPEQRRRLREFSAKFTQYLPTFDVNVLRQHLLFLKATYRVFSSVDQPYVVIDEVKDCKAPTPATRVFLTKAVYRFEVWLKKAVSLRSSDTPLEGHEIPPLDVLIILHAYRLGPWIYDEDLTLRFPQLAKIGDFPFGHIVNAFSLYSIQVEVWTKFDAFHFSLGPEVGSDHRRIPTLVRAGCYLGEDNRTPVQ